VEERNVKVSSNKNPNGAAQNFDEADTGPIVPKGKIVYG
jgi:hypothetical protein